MDIMRYIYSNEKLRDAMHCLAGREPQKKRLKNALLSFHTLKGHRDSVPPKVRPRLDAFWQKVEFARPVGDEGIWQASVNEMNDGQVQACIDDIIGIYDEVTRYQEPFD